MGWFKSHDSDRFPREIVDGNGDTWRNAADHSPGRNGEPVYYNTARDDYSKTPSEIKKEHGRRR
jgi:hypothetical protein